MEISVKGKKALVTGASRGIGRAITETLIKAGASKVYAVDVLKDELNKLAAEVSKVHPVYVDLSDWPATEEILGKLEPVDCLVNNAGVIWPSEPGKIKESDYDKLFAINVKALINVTQTITNTMIDAGIKGSVVNLSSIGAKRANGQYILYCTSKAAVDHITHNYAHQLAAKGIRVNAINPWLVNTGMAVTVAPSQEAMKALQKTSPMGRFIEPHEIAKIVLFLLSDWSSIINGITLPIDYGHSL